MKNLGGPMLGAIFLTAINGQSLADESERSLADLEFMVGEWEGNATVIFRDQPEREPRQETIKSTCDYTLDNFYIVCQTRFERADGNQRDLKIFFNFDAEKKVFNKLYLYDNWPGIVRYPIAFDDPKTRFIGFSSYEGSEGLNAYEKVTWAFSEDFQTIKATEQVLGDVEGGWITTFQFELKKLDP